MGLGMMGKEVIFLDIRVDIRGDLGVILGGI